MGSSMIIEVNGVSFSFIDNDTETGKVNEEQILKNIDLKIDKGSFVAILGHNGSGKSTLAKHFNALLLPDVGTVYIKGMDTRLEENLYSIRSSAGMVFQNPDNQMVAAIVEDEVAFAPENLGVEPKEIRRRVEDCLNVVNMSDFSTASVATLSGGQKQRVAIAAVLAMQPEIIILDESTAMLDPEGREEVLKTIKTLNKTNGMTVILITHYMEEAVNADRTIVINDGKILLDDTPKNVFKNVELLKSVGLDVPQVTELAYELRKSGIDIPEDILTVDECLAELVRILGVAPGD
jgi:energy-coupling factor transport system ATP-binding protein